MTNQHPGAADGRTGSVTERERWLRNIFTLFEATGVLYAVGPVHGQPIRLSRQLPPARLVIHRQTSAHSRCKETLVCAVEVGHIAIFFIQHTLAEDNGQTCQTPQYRRATRRPMLGREAAPLLSTGFEPGTNKH